MFKNSQKAYIITAVIGCLIGILVGQLNFHSIIIIALPILMFIYPITIVLILLNIAPKNLATSIVFKVVVLITFVFSIPDFLEFIINKEHLIPIKNIIPLANQHLGWVLPTILSFIIANVIKTKEFYQKK